jgi:hypothetical protein
MSLRTLIDRATDRVPWRAKVQNVGPAVLGDSLRFPYGAFSFKTHLPRGTAYFIEASTDLKNWSFIAQEVSTGQPIEYIDSEAFKFSYRFYRVIVEEQPSLNVVGYSAVTLPPGFSMIANPFDSPANSVGEMFKGWPDGTKVNKFDTRFFRLVETEIKLGKWTNPSERLSPGEGAIFFNPTSDYKSHSFVGEVMQESLSVPIPSGFSIRSSMVPRAGSIESFGFPVSDGDVIHLFDRDRQQYSLYPFEQGKWASGTPVVSVGESFWVAKTDGANWIQSIEAGERE